MRRATVLVAVLVAAATIPAGTATAATTDPRFEAYVPEPTLTPGTTTQLTVQLVNDAKRSGDTARTARNLNASLLANESAVSVRSGTRFIGDLPDGAVRTVTFTVSVPADIESGTHTLYLDLGYTAGGEEPSRPVPVTVRVDERPQFTVATLEGDPPVGGSGSVNLTLTNTGEEGVTDAQVTLQSRSADVRFGASGTATRYVGDWPAGQNRTVTVEASVADGADRVPHALAASVSFEDSGGDPGQSRSLAVGLTPAPEQSFSLSATSSLLVGDRDTVGVTVTNDGPRAVADAVLALTGSGTVQPVEAEQPLGDLAPGESVEVSFPARVPASAEPGDRQLDFAVRYRRGGEPRVGDTLHATVGVAPEQTFSVSDTSSSLIVGDRGTVEGTVTNDGPRAVEDAVLRLTTQRPTLAPVEPTAVLGDLAPGESASFSFPVRVDAAAEPGDRRLSVAVEYDNADGERRAGDPLGVTAGVTAEQEFALADAESTLLVGDRGTVTATVENEGPETARNAVVRLTTTNPNVRPRETEFAVGDLAPGDTAEVSFPVAIAESAEAGVRQLEFAVEYENSDGDPRLADGLSTRVDVAGEQGFSVPAVNGTLRVGDDGRLVATVTNDGPLPVSDAVVRLAGVPGNIHPRATEFAVGDLAPGDTAEVSFPVEVSESAEPGPRQFDFVVEYRTRQDEPRTSGRLAVRSAVAPERPQFAVEVRGTSVAAGGSGTVSVVVTNNGDEPVTDINAKVFANDPLSVTDDEAFVEGLAPGESAELRFGVGVAGSAIEKTYPLSLDFEYDEADGDTVLSDTYQLPVTATVPEDSGPSVAAIGVVLVVVVAAAGAAVWWRRQ
ncbi:MAG: NEW3 domain-containing protein [Halobacteriaceae archaeon]